MTPLAAYILLFLAVGIGFIFVHLLAGKLIRPSKRNAEKDTIYECGEPTIGSAWVQFDLRFYVVALLFVIFDVEVAFFFPWAEVFGKANAIVNAPTPTTAQEYNDFAAKVLDLAVPEASRPTVPSTPGLKTVDQERAYWKKLAELTQKDMDAYKAVKEVSPGVMRHLGDRRFEDIRGLTAAQVDLLKKHAAEMDAALTKVSREQQQATKEFVTAIRKLSPAEQKALTKVLVKVQGAPPPGDRGPTLGVETVVAAVEQRPEQIDRMLRVKGLDDLQQVTVNDLRVVEDQTTLKSLTRSMPKEVRAINDLASRQRKEVVALAGSILASLKAAGPKQGALWDNLTYTWMSELGGMSPEALASLKSLSPQMMGALRTDLVPGMRQAARNLAWLAFFEILVFFGVLLVGFAYLWRRGDLAWVRSTAAEQPEATSTARAPQTMELETMPRR